MNEPLLKATIRQEVQDRLEQIHREECWGRFSRGFIYMRGCEDCALRATREPDTINALECSLKAAMDDE